MAKFTDALKRLFFPPSGKAAGISKKQLAKVFEEMITAGRQQVFLDFLRDPKRRRDKYKVYREIGKDPEIAAVLDAYANDATQITPSKESPIWIESKDKKVKKILESMLMRTNQKKEARPACRTIAQYGDVMAEPQKGDLVDNKGSKTKRQGITKLKWRKPQKIDRIENTDGILIYFIDHTKLDHSATSLQQDISKMKVMPWDMIHFRRMMHIINEDDASEENPIYGDSVLLPAIRPRDRLRMVEDLVHLSRLVLSMDRRMYKIDTGTAGLDEQRLIIQEWIYSLKKNKYRNSQTGQFDVWANLPAFLEDLFFPTPKDSNSSVETLPGNPNISDVADMEHYVKQLYIALKSSPGYFGYDIGDFETNKTLSSQDRRFSRSVMSVQEAYIEGLERVCKIELIMAGYDEKKVQHDPKLFKVAMTPVSQLELLSYLDGLSMIADLAGNLARIPDDLELNKDKWKEFVLSAAFGMDADEIQDLVDIPVEQAPPEGEGGGGGFGGRGGFRSSIFDDEDEMLTEDISDPLCLESWSEIQKDGIEDVISSLIDRNKS